MNWTRTQLTSITRNRIRSPTKLGRFTIVRTDCVPNSRTRFEVLKLESRIDYRPYHTNPNTAFWIFEGFCSRIPKWISFPSNESEYRSSRIQISNYSHTSRNILSESWLEYSFQDIGYWGKRFNSFKCEGIA